MNFRMEVYVTSSSSSSSQSGWWAGSTPLARRDGRAERRKCKFSARGPNRKPDYSRNWVACKPLWAFPVLITATTRLLRNSSSAKLDQVGSRAVAGVFHWQAVLVIKKLGDDLQSITLATARPAFLGHAKYATLSYYEPEMPPYYEA